VSAKPQRSPGELELAILDVLWRLGPSTPRQVLDELSAKRELAYSTVLTVLRRLEAKRLARRRRVGRGHVYRAAVAAPAVRRRSVKELLGRFFEGSPAELVMELIRDEQISPAELARIEELIRSHRRD